MKKTKDSDNQSSKVRKETNPVNAHICSVIRRLRVERGLRVQDVALRTGIPEGSYSCLETGRYRIHLENLYRILSVLEARISDVWPTEAPLDSDGRVTRNAIRSALEEAQRKQTALPGLSDILEVVCTVCALDLRDIIGRSRKRLPAQARHLAAQLVSETPNLTLTALSRALNRNTSTFSHSLRRISRMPMGRRREFLRRLQEARTLLKQRIKRGRKLKREEAGG